jgi:hypothetical protein
MASAGAVLVKLGRADAGRKLIEDAARDAAQLPAAGWPGNYRSEAARILAPHDLGRALALVEAFKVKFPSWWQFNCIDIWQGTAFGWLAVARAPRDPARANALIDRGLARSDLLDGHGSLRDLTTSERGNSPPPP